ncbi:transmembrane protease serine 2-like [Osmerus eperlanus]|uniref:transmembrane protease serine 2-like n=1 Tax=Osmerus eperlanus TaxID=29151 RepID=UPI002E0DDACF
MSANSEPGVVSVNDGSEEEEGPPPADPPAGPQYVHQVALYPPSPPQTPATIPPNGRRNCRKWTVTAVVSALLLLLVAGVLLGYYLSSMCFGVRCRDDLCVLQSQWCDGVTDCPGGEDETMCFRLFGSGFLLQIYRSEDRSWKPVCSEGWTTNLGQTACQRMGYSVYTSAQSGQMRINTSNGYLQVKTGSSPDTNILKLFINSNNCSSGSAVTLQCVDCGTRETPTSSGAGNEPPASLGAWCWHALLTSSVNCSGTIISPYWIVTAASCVQKDSNPQSWKVFAGVVNTWSTAFHDGLQVSHILAHEAFQTNTGRNNIALMRLTKPLVMTSNIRPACLPNVGLDFKASRKCWTTGFGSTELTNVGSEFLMEAEVTLLDPAACRDLPGSDGAYTRDTVCAGNPGAVVQPCEGDLGGPLVTEEDSVWWLIGDRSWAHGCVSGVPAAYGNVPFYLEWLYEQMQKYQDEEQYKDEGQYVFE